MNESKFGIVATQSEAVCRTAEEAFLDECCQAPVALTEEETLDGAEAITMSEGEEISASSTVITTSTALAVPETFAPAAAEKVYTARPYQTECLEKLAEVREQGTDQVIVVMACGLGKTVTVILDVEQFLLEHPGSRVLYLCHNGEILSEAKNKFEHYFGPRYGYGFFMTYVNEIEVDDTQKEPTFLFASFQTMSRRRKQFARDEFDYIIVDEAHHVQARTYASTVRYFEPRFQLGMTATPFRMDGKKIEELLGEVVYNMDIVRGVFDGWLADLHYKLMLDDISLGLKDFLDKNQKFTVSQLNREVFIPARDQEIVRRIKERVEQCGLTQPKMVIYCRTIKHARRIATIYGRDKAVAIHAKQSAEEVKEILKRLERGEIEAVTSVQKLNEGIDLPSLNMLVFLRNTVSRNVYEQQLGRGTRREGNKTVVEILDFVANAERMKFVFEFWQELQDRARRYYGGEEIDDVDEDDELVDVNIDEGNTRIAANSKAKNPGKSRGTRTKDDKIPKFDHHFVLDFYDGKFVEQDIDIMDVLERAYQGKGWAREEAMNGLAEYAKELGRPPKEREVNANPNLPTVDWYKRQCGSYNNALKEIGLIPNRESSERCDKTKEEGLAGLTEFAKELRRPPKQREVDANPDLPNSAWYKKQCGSYNNALKEIGLIPNLEFSKRCDKTKEEGLAGLAEYARELGRPPRTKEVDANPNLPSSTWYKRQCGSYNNALKEIGFYVDSGLEMKKKEEEALRDLANYMEELGHTPTSKEVDANPNLQSSNWYAWRFGGFGNALKMIGAVPHRRHWKTAEQALEAVRQDFELHGGPMKQREVDASPNSPGGTTLHKLFGSFSKAKDLVMYTYQSVALPPKEDLDSDEAEKTDLGEAEDPGLLDPEGFSN